MSELPKKSKKKLKKTKGSGLLAEKMIKTVIRRGSTEDKLRDKINQLNRENLVSTFTKEILSFDKTHFMTKEEIDCLNRVQSYLEELLKKCEQSLQSWRKFELDLKKFHSEYAGLLQKNRLAQEMEHLSLVWKAKMSREQKAVQNLSDDEMKDAILQMRLLKYRLLPFDIKNYLEKIFKGRQKGRAYKSFYEH